MGLVAWGRRRYHKLPKHEWFQHGGRSRLGGRSVHPWFPARSMTTWSASRRRPSKGAADQLARNIPC